MNVAGGDKGMDARAPRVLERSGCRQDVAAVRPGQRRNAYPREFARHGVHRFRIPLPGDGSPSRNVVSKIYTRSAILKCLQESSVPTLSRLSDRFGKSIRFEGSIISLYGAAPPARVPDRGHGTKFFPGSGKAAPDPARYLPCDSTA